MPEVTCGVIINPTNIDYGIHTRILHSGRTHPAINLPRIMGS
jgi:hypothetical protein